MKIAIIGFPGSGKSTVFKAITDYNAQKGLSEDLSKPRLGTVKVKDERLNKLAQFLKPKKITQEELVFTDLPGFNLTPIKNAETTVHVVGVFSGRDYKKDIENMETEFIISDLAIIEKKLASLEKEMMAKPTNEKELQKDILLKAKNELDNNKALRGMVLSRDEEKGISGYQFLSRKQTIVLTNLDEEQMRSGLVEEIDGYCRGIGIRNISLCAMIEAEIKDLDETERAAFAKEMGISDLVSEKVVRAARELVGLITFFTGSLNGEEVKAWPVAKGANAPEAAGKIHSDIQKGFIRAEVVSYDDFVKCGSFIEAKNKGLLRLEGKEYIVMEGDILTFHFSK